MAVYDELLRLNPEDWVNSLIEMYESSEEYCDKHSGNSPLERQLFISLSGVSSCNQLIITQSSTNNT